MVGRVGQMRSFDCLTDRLVNVFILFLKCWVHEYSSSVDGAEREDSAVYTGSDRRYELLTLASVTWNSRRELFTGKNNLSLVVERPCLMWLTCVL